MRVTDHTLGGTIILGALLMGYRTLQLPGGAPGLYGPAVFPLIISVALAGTGAALALRSLTQKTQRDVSSAEQPKWLQGATVVGALCFAMVCLPYLGFVLTLLPILFFLLLSFGVGALRSAVIGVPCTLAIKVVFTQILAVPLPVSPFLPL